MPIENDTRAINLLNNNDSFEINGDTKIPINNVKTTAYTLLCRRYKSV